VARWCAEPIEMGHPGFVLCPLVLAPNAVPVVSDATAIAADPELAVLSAMSHADESGAVERAMAILDVMRQLDTARSWLYADLVMMALPDAARRALEDMMDSGT
jgi:hypothetical protein